MKKYGVNELRKMFLDFMESKETTPYKGQHMPEMYPYR